LTGFVILCFGLFAGSALAQTSPTVTLTPSSGFQDQQIIEVSGGANSLFTANQSVKILECSVGATSDADCDGDTINADSVLTKTDGSFDYKSYELFLLPSSALEEPADNKPVCNATHQCELYVGLDQTNFTKPHVFSAPFTISASSATGSSPSSSGTSATTVAGSLGKTGTASRRSFAIAVALIGVGLLCLAAGWAAATHRLPRQFRRGGGRAGK